jgi:hypothetical protein
MLGVCGQVLVGLVWDQVVEFCGHSSW